MSFWMYCQEVEAFVGPDVVIEKINVVRNFWTNRVEFRATADYLRATFPELCRSKLDLAAMALAVA